MEGDRKMFVSCRGSGPGTQEGFLATRKAQFVEDLVWATFATSDHTFIPKPHQTQKCFYNHIRHQSGKGLLTMLQFREIV